MSTERNLLNQSVGTRRLNKHVSNCVSTSCVLFAGIVYDCDLRVADIVAFFFLLTPVNTEFFHVVQIGIPSIFGAQSYGAWLGISVSWSRSRRLWNGFDRFRILVLIPCLRFPM